MVLLEIIVEKCFKFFVEDCLLVLVVGSFGLVGYFGFWLVCLCVVEKLVILVIGLEGGWIFYEVDKLCEVGLYLVQFGECILCVEIVVSVLFVWLF